MASTAVQAMTRLHGAAVATDSEQNQHTKNLRTRPAVRIVRNQNARLTAPRRFPLTRNQDRPDRSDRLQ